MCKTLIVKRSGICLALCLLPLLNTGCAMLLWNDVSRHDRANLTPTGLVQSTGGDAQQYLIAHDSVSDSDVAIPLGSRYRPSPFVFNHDVNQIEMSDSEVRGVSTAQLKAVCDTPLRNEQFTQAKKLLHDPAYVGVSAASRNSNARVFQYANIDHFAPKGSEPSPAFDRQTGMSVLVIREDGTDAGGQYDPSKSIVVLLPNKPKSPRAEQAARIAGAAALSPATAALDTAVITSVVVVGTVLLAPAAIVAGVSKSETASPPSADPPPQNGVASQGPAARAGPSQTTYQ